MRVLLAPDKFRGTARAREVSAALAEGARRVGWVVDECPLSDGGEGFVEVLGGATHSSPVCGPLGTTVDASWRLTAATAVIESATACGAALAPAPTVDDAVNATTFGVGELIGRALGAGATTILIGVGGSASTDGGRGALDALGDLVPFPPDVDVVVACDVDAPFLNAATVFSAQKGADAATVAILHDRLEQYARTLAARFGRDVLSQTGAGAAGGLAGGLWAAGARLVPGFELVAHHVDLRRRLLDADAVITGEGRVDRTSLHGKVVGSVVAMAHQHDRRVALVAGAIDPTVATLLSPATLVSLSERYGITAALHETRRRLTDAASDICRGFAPDHRG